MIEVGVEPVTLFWEGGCSTTVPTPLPEQPDIRENDVSTFLIPGKLEAEPRAVLRPDLHPSSHVGAESRYCEQS